MANVTVAVKYRVEEQKKEAFVRLVFRGWKLLDELGFIEPGSPRLYRDVSDPEICVEMFTWLEGASEAAHDHPDVVILWEEMDLLLSRGDGESTREFSHFERIPEDG